MEQWKKLGEEDVYRGWRRIIRKRFELPNGRELDFDILGAGHYVTVAAVTEAGAFILIRQYRPGPERFILSFPEGGIDPGESPEDAALRELLEETGFTAERITLLKMFHSSYTTQQQYCLLATGCRPTGQHHRDENEFIEVMTVTTATLRQLIRDAADHTFNNVGCAYLALEQLGKL